MAKSHETFNKKEAEKRKLQKRKEKEQRKEERKASAKGGKSLEDMMAYVDENGNLTTVPQDPTKKKQFKEEDIVLGSRNNDSFAPTDLVRTGKVTFFNDSKGYGFIKDLQTQESIFVHINNLQGPLKENDKVSFEVEKGPKGPSAVRVKVTG